MLSHLKFFIYPSMRSRFYCWCFSESTDLSNAIFVSTGGPHSNFAFVSSILVLKKIWLCKLNLKNMLSKRSHTQNSTYEWVHLDEVLDEVKLISGKVDRSLSTCRGWVPGPLQIPKSWDDQILYIKWCGICR